MHYAGFLENTRFRSVKAGAVFSARLVSDQIARTYKFFFEDRIKLQMNSLQSVVFFTLNSGRNEGITAWSFLAGKLYHLFMANFFSKM